MSEYDFVFEPSTPAEEAYKIRKQQLEDIRDSLTDDDLLLIEFERKKNKHKKKEQTNVPWPHHLH